MHMHHTPEFTPDEKSELDSLRSLHALPADRLVQFSARQLSILSAMPVSSVGPAMERAQRTGELVPAVRGSKVFRAGELSRWCLGQSNAVATRLGAAVATSPQHAFSDPAEPVRRYLKQLLAQPKGGQ